MVEKLGIRVMPTLVIVKNRKVEHHMRGFDELGSSEDFSTELLAHVLANHGALTSTEEEHNPPELDGTSLSGYGVNRVRVSRSNNKSENHRSLDEHDFF